MWDTLQVTNEGTSEIKRSTLNALTHEFELFRMFPNESISDMQKRFTHIVNHLVALELDKRKKGLSLKASTSQVQEEEDEEDSDYEIFNETMRLLKKRRETVSKERNKEPNFQGQESQRSLFLHECGKAGHRKYQCPAYLKKVEGGKNNLTDFKSKKAYNVWDFLEEDSTSSTSEEEEKSSTSTNIDKQSEVNSYETSSYSISENSPSYDELYNTFIELHEELKKLARVNIERKIIVLLYEKKIQDMQKELDELKLEK
ncbi:hypothetical protein Lal_00015578 [Lupinus albus]|nr:hypothetical protein Lal_00015578 [Lupinus albus]